jgi:integrase
MAVDDLWYLKKRDPNTKKPIPSKRHGRGKRWRVRYVDAAGEGRERLFDKKAPAEDFDAQCRAGVAPEVMIDRPGRSVTFAEYAERWRLSREATWTTETRRRIPQNIRKHLVPVFGSPPMRSITLTDVMAWLTRSIDNGVPKSSLSLYFGLFKTIMNAAVIDKAIPDNPCAGVKLSQVLRGLSRAPKWVPTEDQVLTLIDVVPDRFRAAVWLGAGQGMRLAEVLGMENGTRCTDFLHRELHVIQQLRHSPEHYSGFYLAPPKSGSSGTVDLDPLVAEHLAEHIRLYPPTEFQLPDITNGDRITRTVAILFTSQRGKLFTDRYWAELWRDWRDAAGWPKEGTFHSLRHFFATTLMSNGVEPQDVQKALRHANLRITLETYVHWLPKKDRPRGVVGQVLINADHERQSQTATKQDQS